MMWQEHEDGTYLCPCSLKHTIGSDWCLSTRSGLLQNIFCYQTLVQSHLFFIYLSSSHERKSLQLLHSYMKYWYLLCPPQQGIILFKVSLTTALHQRGFQQIHHNFTFYTGNPPWNQGKVFTSKTLSDEWQRLY